MIFSLTRSPPSVEQDRIHHPSVSSTYRATYSDENMAPSRSTPRMMQMTRAAFQAVVSLNEQATDPKSHTLVRITYTLSSPVLSPANSDGRPHFHSFRATKRNIHTCGISPCYCTKPPVRMQRVGGNMTDSRPEHLAPRCLYPQSVPLAPSNVRAHARAQNTVDRRATPLARRSGARC